MRRLHDERGSAVVEFSLISVLLLMLLFAVLQVAALFYVRSVAAAAAADGARYAANADVGPSAGADRASELIGRGLGPAMAARLPCTGRLVSDPASNLQVSQVQCQGRMNSVLLPLGAFVQVRVTGQSLKDQP
ncbi:MAG: TadE/TadG family type IV pilus assembly protein [Jatrophihabitantaceae bacterium]